MSPSPPHSNGAESPAAAILFAFKSDPRPRTKEEIITAFPTQFLKGGKSSAEQKFSAAKRALKESGIVLELDKNNRYSLELDSAFLGEVTQSFTNVEAMVLYAAGNMWSARRRDKINSTLLFKLATLIGIHQPRAQLLRLDSAIDSSKLQPILDALQHGLLLATNSNKTLIAPLELVEILGRWWLIGVDQDSAKLDIWAVHELEGIEPNDRAQAAELRVTDLELTQFKQSELSRLINADRIHLSLNRHDSAHLPLRELTERWYGLTGQARPVANSDGWTDDNLPQFDLPEVSRLIIKARGAARVDSGSPIATAVQTALEKVVQQHTGAEPAAPTTRGSAFSHRASRLDEFERMTLATSIVQIVGQSGEISVTQLANFLQLSEETVTKIALGVNSISYDAIDADTPTAWSSERYPLFDETDLTERGIVRVSGELLDASLTFTAAELDLLITGIKTVLMHLPAQFKAAGESAIEKIRLIYDSRYSAAERANFLYSLSENKRLTALSARETAPELSPLNRDPQYAKKLNTVLTALVEKRGLNFKYHNGSAVKDRTALINSMSLIDGDWLADAYDLAAGKTRHFYLHKMSDPHFGEILSDDDLTDIAASLAATRQRKHATVDILVAPQALTLIKEFQPRQYKTVKGQEPVGYADWIHCSVDLWRPENLEKLVFSAPGQIIVLGSAASRERIAMVAAQLLQTVIRDGD
ncbi:WYL domain-containing protein [Canibacter zhoujuaniae]|uniref:WYL domain-containing protein n=1 Tax=Canibacter zhoujuaniae TaxID=2708343 RepID=UPI001420C73C|nr:WYL domain-containing protein [Canibacter zhoujuaniae]